MNKVFWLLLLSIYLSGCTPTGRGGDYLEIEEIVSLIAGHTLTGTFVSGRFRSQTFDVFMMKNGSLSSRFSDGSEGFGKWRVLAGGALCVSTSQVRQGEERCFLIRADGDEYLLIRSWDQSVNAKFQVLSGKVRDLEVP